MDKNCQNSFAYPKVSTFFSKIVHKQHLHACDFLHVCVLVVAAAASPGTAGRPVSSPESMHLKKKRLLCVILHIDGAFVLIDK